MTMRPQLASSPAMAVLTRGELAIDRPMRLAAASLSAPVTVISMNFDAPSPSRTIWWARSRMTASALVRKSLSAGSSGPEKRSVLPAAPVANSIRESLVEVSLSTVIELNVHSQIGARMPCSTGAGIFASVNT